MLALRLAARALRATHLIDRAYRRFARMRARLVLRAAPDSFYDVYNDVAYSTQGSYRADSHRFRADLFPWEQTVIERHFPPPPGRILVGAAGGGREALALAGKGYDVIAFEPAPTLARSMAQVALTKGSVEVLVGRYQDLPLLAAVDDPRKRVDLAARGPFDAALLGWASFSHLRSDSQCIETLRRVGGLTAGPVFVSYFSRIDGRLGSSDETEFSIDLGYYRPMPEGQVAGLAGAAGLRVVEEDHYSGWSLLIRT